MNRIINGLTLLELVIGIFLMAIIVLGIANIDIFSSFHVTNVSRKSKLQNEVSIVAQHMTKEIGRAIGNEMTDGVDQVVEVTTIGGNAAVKVYVDSGPIDITDGNYQPGNGNRADATDRWIAYRFTDGTGPVAGRYQIRYCPQCTNLPCTTCSVPWSDNIIARNIVAFSIIKPNAPNQLNNNFITVPITGCWDPANADLVTNPNGTPENPCVTMNSQIRMPSVSTN